MSAPLVSIVVPVFNAGQYLSAALDSIRAQSIADIEVILVDDGSAPPVTDAIGAGIPRFARLRQANAGPAAARNNGIRQARGAYVAFLDADDLWLPATLAILLRGFRDAPGVDVVQGLVKRFRTPETEAEERAAQAPYAGFNLGALLIRAEALRGLGPLDERLRESEDVDLFIRMQQRRLRRLVVPETVLLYRDHPASTTAVTPPAPLQRGAAANWIRLVQGSLARRREAADAPPAVPEATPPPITVAIVVKDGARYLPAALASVRAQTLAPMEIVAVAAPSRDGTLDFLAAQPDVRLIHESGASLAEARNQAIAAARGEIIAFLDHDDLWRPSKLAAQAGILALFRAPAACISTFRIVRDADPDDPAKVTMPPHRAARVGWTPSALLAHRDVFRAVGPFDPALGFGCDTDWFRRLRRSGVPCGLASQPLTEKRRHADNLSRDAEANRAAMFRMLAKHRAERHEG